MHDPLSSKTQPGTLRQSDFNAPDTIPNPTADADMLQPMRPVSPPPQRPVVNDFYASRGARSNTRRGGGGNWLWVLLAGGALAMTLIITMTLIFILRTTNNDEQNDVVAAQNNLPTATSAAQSTEDTSTPAPTDGTAPAVPTVEENAGLAPNENSLVIEPWDGKERFTVLLMGLDRRPGETTPLCTRTDTMLVVSLDPVTKQIGILSIPRDLYVEIPNWGLNRINTACRLGDLTEPGSGPLFAMQAVQYNLGIRINDYIMVDFQTFIGFIDRIGGIDVDVPRDIHDATYPDMYYGYDPVHITKGLQHFDGNTALKFARSRHDSDDTDRAKRQQIVLFAVWDKVLSLDMLGNLALQALPLWNDFSEGVQTGLRFDQFVQLALFAKDIPRDSIKSGVITWDYMEGYRTEGGAQVAIPNRYMLGRLMVDVFGENYNQ